MKRVHDSLQRVFQRSRIVFWYDPNEEWREAFHAFTDDTVTRLEVRGNEFGTKVRIVRDPNPAARFLVYVPSARPPDGENWLLDLLLQGHEYKADKASLVLQDAGLPEEFRFLAEEHAGFFRSEARLSALRDMVSPSDQARDLRLKMMAILAGTAVEVDALLLHFLCASVETPLHDPVVSCFKASGLVLSFWQEVERHFGYSATIPSLRDFAVTLFRGANPLDASTPQHPHARVFLQRWKDSQVARAAFRHWSHQLAKMLQIEGAINSLDERNRIEATPLAESDTFEIFDKFTLHRLSGLFERNAGAADIRAAIQKRRGSFWLPDHKHGYAALEYALELRELLASAELTMDSIDAGLSRYVGSWWRIDRAYRLCMWNLRHYNQQQVMERIARWADKAYLNNYLLPLTDRWSDHVRTMTAWQCLELPAQRQFYVRYVKPYLDRGQKVFVIVSDALRFEAAADFAQQLQSANRWTAEVEALFGSLPTYTQLGMASLLPGQKLTVDAATATLTIDGRSASGIENRARILNLACGGRATALQAEEFLELNTKTDGRALMRDHEVIYIFHNHIDKVGDSASTEAKTFDAVEEAFRELELIMKKVANINGSNMLLTADHGFLFQQEEVSAGDMTPLPAADEWTYRARRFSIGRGIPSSTAVKVFSAAALGLIGDWSAAFPTGLGRFPLQGSGKRFVHGGTSLQEVVVPVVKIHKARADDTDSVEVELIRVPAKITTGQLAIALYQDKPAAAKLLARTLRVGVFSKEGTSLSEIKTVTFDSSDDDPRCRESTLVLVLSPAADAFNNCEVDLRLEEIVPGTSQVVTYKTHALKLQKRFVSDFDDL